MRLRTFLPFTLALFLLISPLLTACDSKRDNKLSTTPTVQLDKGDEVDQLLDELNNALKNVDTMDDVK